MFNMPIWDVYLTEFCENAARAGATPLDILELFHIKSGQLLAKAKAAEARAEALAKGGS